MPDMGITEIMAIIGTALTAGSTAYGIKSQMDAKAQAEDARRQAQKQQEQQALTTRQQQMRAEAPTLQSQVGGSLTPGAFNSLTAALTGNPGATAPITGSGGGTGGGSLTPAMENLFPGGGVPSLTEPWPQNV